ncbi:hypothetical protein [Paraburkholderia sp. D1E]|uniref:hypothetical protein n=1 Tax=Paraburkholderia sp. D1E TaxID=3461398 RepID=UPI0040468343
MTLTGTGGDGKISLAIEVARQVAFQFDENVSFVELAPEHKGGGAARDHGKLWATGGKRLRYRPVSRGGVF